MNDSFDTVTYYCIIDSKLNCSGYIIRAKQRDIFVTTLRSGTIRRNGIWMSQYCKDKTMYFGQTEHVC